MRNRILISLFSVFSLAILVGTSGCSKKDESEQPEKITANINNNSPEAKNAPSAQFDESPGELAARMGGKGGMAKKMGAK